MNDILPMTMMLYAVIHGKSWNDIEYFTSFQKACASLILLTRYNDVDDFHPFMYSFTSDDEGCCRQTFNALRISNMEELYQFDQEALNSDPTIAKYLIEMSF